MSSLFKLFLLCCVLFQACLYLYDIPSIEHPGQILGSVVFGESFLDSAIRTLVPGTQWMFA